ncbi:MAG: efflux RND transporter permease subunit [Saprospiraceae bacterium]|nr:efflux RND transporter permease subunit [Saprospiraceae bacterium]
MDKIKKYFGLSNWAINNPMTVWVMIFALLAVGVLTYVNMPKEDFPEIIESTTYVSTVFPGNAAEDIEKLITEPLEEEFKNITGVGDISSQSLQDYSIITVEWDDTKITPEDGKRKVKDQIDLVKADSNWPTLDTGAPVDPNAFDLNISEETPVININLTGESYTRQQLKGFGEYLEGQIEALEEVKEVDILGVEDLEVEVAVDVYKMSAAGLSFNDVIGAISNENTTISGGNVVSNGLRRNLRVVGEIEQPSELNNIVVKSEDGMIYLRDIAKVNFKEVDKTTYARNYQQPVVMLNVKKKSGKNLLDATDKVKDIVADAQENVLPKNLTVEITGDSSSRIRNQVSELENSIIFGVLLVVGVLMFFLGFRNAAFVGIAIPLSMLLSMVLLPRIGPMITGSNISLNTMTLFALIMGLGMLVDNGIVVVENVYRKVAEGIENKEAAKQGVGEIAWPIIISTLTTLAAFFPLAFWPGIMGKFMVYFPVTLSMVLAASLFVALVINSMLTSQFMSAEEKPMKLKSLIFISSILFLIGALFIASAYINNPQLLKGVGGLLAIVGAVLSIYGWARRKKTSIFKAGLGILGLAILFFLFSNNGASGLRGFGSLFITIALLLWTFKYIITPSTNWFQNRFLPWLEGVYQKALGFALHGRYIPIIVTALTLMTLVGSFVFFGMQAGSGKLQVLFFPDNIANQAIVYIEYPEGTDIEKTDALTKQVEQDVIKVVDQYKVNSDDPIYGALAKVHGNGYNRMVESVISQVGEGAGDPNTDGGNSSEMPHKGKVTVQFREFKLRDNTNTNDILEEIREAVKGYPGVIITAEKDANGPPAGPPINLELAGENYEDLYALATNIKGYINDQNIPGIEELKIDVNTNKPEMEIYVDREKAGNFGLTTAMVGQTLRQSLYGWEASTFKKDGEDYKIMVRFNDDSRYNINALLNQKVTFRNNQGRLLTVPISSVVSTKNTATFSQIKRKNLKRVVTVYSNVLEGANPTQIVGQIDNLLTNYDMPGDVNYRFTGEQEEQAENMSFLSIAFGVGFTLIFLIIVGQFNSLSKPMIIGLAIMLSLTGVFMGIAIFKLNFIILMMMLGIIALAGIVVNNAIVLIDYTQLMIDRKKEALGVPQTDMLTRDQYREAIIEGGTARLRPVLLTAITTILGLVPLTIGLNINFFTLFSEFDPQIFIGGDNTIFWRPMTLTIIFGLSFATFLTLIVVPVLFFLRNRLKIRFSKNAPDNLGYDNASEAA